MEIYKYCDKGCHSFLLQTISCSHIDTYFGMLFDSISYILGTENKTMNKTEKDFLSAVSVAKGDWILGEF